MTFRVAIIEDDPMVAAIHTRWMRELPGFSVVAVFDSAEAVIPLLGENRIDLIILDLRLTGVGGTALLERIRQGRHATDAIVVTASREPDVVESVLRLGAIDYLVKPFTQERFERAIDVFVSRRAMLRRQVLTQSDVDRLRGVGSRAAERTMPKGLSPQTLDGVLNALRAADGVLSAEEVAGVVGVSRVVARRYLEYLLNIGRARLELRYGQPGRPRKLYAAVE